MNIHRNLGSLSNGYLHASVANSSHFPLGERLCGPEIFAEHAVSFLLSISSSYRITSYYFPQAFGPLFVSTNICPFTRFAKKWETLFFKIYIVK